MSPVPATDTTKLSHDNLAYYAESKLDGDIWEMIKPDRDQQPDLITRPGMPLLTDHNPVAISIADLSATLQKAHQYNYNVYQDQIKAYERQKKHLTTARDTIRSSVDRKIGQYLRREMTEFEWIDTLQGIVSIELSQQIADLSEEQPSQISEEEQPIQQVSQAVNKIVNNLVNKTVSNNIVGKSEVKREITKNQLVRPAIIAGIVSGNAGTRFQKHEK
ncbi:hypothetical protein QQS21_001923 [Conoideocrella luteorostrata]|uniref:Uncharacterized protein n=1 Tax=Conoideocrella luteorostrata TaxID=1105319 RepID=A0AAJ0G1Q3_9HYPO|nr:hypothetical protein QQS21_001923 [Conoideocrella luteorostrata]